MLRFLDKLPSLGWQVAAYLALCAVAGGLLIVVSWLLWEKFGHQVEEVL